MASCKNCLCEIVCKYNDGVNEYCKGNCPHFKDRTRFVELPCKVGDTVYYIAEKFVKRGRKKIAIKYFESGIVDNIQLGQIMVPQVTVCNEDNTWITFDAVRDLGKTVFLTREEAEKALNSSEKPNSRKEKTNG